MQWLVYAILAMIAGAAALAIYEWRKGVKLREDIVLPHRNDARSDPMARTRQSILRKGDGRFDEPNAD